MNTQETEPVPVLRGVSLTQYAAVQAGLAEGIDLDLVLENERIVPASWLDADDAWSDRLLEDLEQDGPLQQAFDEHLAEAQTRYGRRVPPLDESLDAWLDFVRHWSAAAEPIAFLATLELRASDLIRLHRTWSQRLALEPALARQAQEILAREPGELPVPRPVSRELHRSPRAPEPPASAVAGEPREDGEPGVFVDVAAWLAAEVHAPIAADVAPDAPNPEPQAPDLEMTVLPTASPLRRSSFAASPPERSSAEAPKPSSRPIAFEPRAAVSLSSAPAESDGAASITAPMQPGLFKAALPFVHGAPSIAEMSPSAPDVSRRVPSDLGATGVMPGGLLAAALPFMQGATNAPPAAHESRLPPADLGATGVLPSGLLAAALPFMHGAGAASPAAEKARVPVVDLGATVVAQPGSIGPATPFTPPVAAAPPSPDRSPAPGHDLGATGVMPAGSVGAALPFLRASRPGVDNPEGGKHALSKRVPVAQPAPSVTPAVPTPGVAPVRPVSPSPGSPPVPLTLAQYASLCAELAAFPGATEHTFLRYGLAVTSSRIALDLAWRERLRRNTDEHREWQKLFHHYEAHFKKAGR